jgi:hypothetical protein
MTEPPEGRNPYTDRMTLARMAMEAARRKWFCSGPDCTDFDHGVDEGFRLALVAFDNERQRQIAEKLEITVE